MWNGLSPLTRSQSENRANFLATTVLLVVLTKERIPAAREDGAKSESAMPINEQNIRAALMNARTYRIPT